MGLILRWLIFQQTIEKKRGLVSIVVQAIRGGVTALGIRTRAPHLLTEKAPFRTVVAGADPYVRIPIGCQLPIIATKSFLWEYLHLFPRLEELQSSISVRVNG